MCTGRDEAGCGGMRQGAAGWGGMEEGSVNCGLAALIERGGAVCQSSSPRQGSTGGGICTLTRALLAQVRPVPGRAKADAKVECVGAVRTAGQPHAIIGSAQICMANTVTMQVYVCWLSCTEIRPSFCLSQKAVAADAIAAPLFYWMMHVTTYLNFLLSLARSLMHASMICWDH